MSESTSVVQVVQSETKDEVDKIQPEKLIETPKICLFNVDEEIQHSLTQKGYQCYGGSLGSYVKLPDICYGEIIPISLNHFFPENLHEYDIIITDFYNFTTVPYEPSHHQKSCITSAENISIGCCNPQTLFNPIPLACGILQEHLYKEKRKQFITITFATLNDIEEYEIFKIGRNGYSSKQRIRKQSHTFFHWIDWASSSAPKKGKEISASKQNSSFSSFLSKYTDEMKYSCIFHHQTINGKKKENFIPLLVNRDEEIVSFFKSEEEGFTFVFPNVKDKKSFIEELIGHELPGILPKFFPYSAEHQWLRQEQYMLPGEEALEDKRLQIEQKYKENIKKVNEEIEDKREQFQFLHDLLTQTSDELVKTVEYFLNWLEFENIENMDEKNLVERLGEDLQIKVPGGMIVTEVKGIGGTSKDKECSQVTKCRLRQMKKNRSIDVYALYIVNHQRHQAPHLRTNPPFNDQQIEDAIEEDRGLLSTYQLYHLYFWIEGGILSKEEARERFIVPGLVHFLPKVSIGKAFTIFQNGLVGGYKLDGSITIRKGQEMIILNSNGILSKRTIKDIHLDNVSVESVSSGQVGIRFSSPIRQSDEVYEKYGTGVKKI